MLKGRRKLFEAINASDIVVLEHILKMGVSPNVDSLPVVYGSGNTERTVELEASPLMLSASRGDISIIILLLQYGTDINAVSRFDGETALHWACREGKASAVTVLLEHGADPHAANHKAETPFALALVNHHHDVVALFNHSFTPVKRKDEQDALQMPTSQPSPSYYDPEHMQQLINNLTIAASNGVLERVKSILAQGVSVDGKNDHGCNALYCAAFAGRLDMIELLFLNGADVDIYNANGVTALSVACDKGQYQVAKVLVGRNADLNALDHENTTALLYATSRSQRAIVQLLLENGADPNIISDRGNLPLCVAAFHQQAEIVKLLLGYGAAPNSVGYDGFTALAIAAAQDHVANAKTLLEYKADPDARSKQGMTALIFAAGRDILDVARILIQKGAGINLVDEDGRSAMMYAVAMGKAESVRLLLSVGADASLKDKQGNTALSWAQSVGHNEIEQILESGTSKVNLMLKQGMAKSNQPNSDTDREVNRDTGLEALQAELNMLTGMAEVKTEVSQLVNFLKFQQMRKAKGLSVPEQSFHMVFTGNPGTGKTTISRLVSKIYKSLGILSQGQFIETDRAGLVGGYLGQTALKTKGVVESAIGGVLFIDEAYSLSQRGIADGDAYGEEAIATLLKLMEDHRDDLIVIVAGYTEPMQKFIRSNPGLQSRFNKFLHFDDYAPAELTEIFRHFAASGDYKLHPATELKLTNVFAALHARRDETFGNARLARNLFEKAINAHANRMVSAGAVDEASLVTLYPEDIPNA